MVYEVIINVVVVLGFLKGAELLLRIQQKKAVQEFLEDMTLRLDDVDFKEISRRMATPEALFAVIVLAYIETTIAAVVMLFGQGSAWKPGGVLYEAFGDGGRYLQAGILVLSFITLGLCWKWPIPRLMRWVIGKGSSRFYVLLRLVGFVISGYIVFAIYQLGLFSLESALLGHGTEEILIRPPFRAPIFTTGLIMIWPMCVIFSVIVQAVGALLHARHFWVRWMFAPSSAV
jgi:hypothetical protein